MSTLTEPSERVQSSWRTVLAIVALVVAQLLVLGVVYKHAIAFECLANWPAWACRSASGALVAIFTCAGAVALYAMLRPAPFRGLVAEAGGRPWALGLNALGFVSAFVPVLFLRDGAGSWAIAAAFAVWVPATALLLIGFALAVAPGARWRSFVQSQGLPLAIALLAGMATPLLSILIRPLWTVHWVTETTFAAVVSILRGLGYEVWVDADAKVIATADRSWGIAVAPECSGIEGIALVTLFVSLYLGLFRKDLRFPLAFLLYPVGLLASALFNIVRIAVLVIIGLEGQPELAVGGFHSHAGWLMFTVVALGIVFLAQSVPMLRRTAPAAATAPAGPPPFWQDPVMAAILPFAVFMLTAIPVSAFSETPGAIYPLRVLIVGATVLGFWGIFRALGWRIDPLAVGSGALIGIVWCVIPVPPSEAAPYGALAGAALIAWFVFRGIGTVLLVPLVEEMFFRAYLHDRFRLGRGAMWDVFAAFATAGLFAALHDRWMEAFVAGLIFSWVARRPGGRITDAILSHAVANAIVFGWATITGNLAII